MRNITQKFVILWIVLFSTSMVFAQSELSPRLAKKDALQKKEALQKAANLKKGIVYLNDRDPNAKAGNTIPSDAQFDLQFDYPVGIGGGEAGIETDGSYIYTTKWNGGDFYKYGMDGTYIETFTCGSAASVRDLAYDGTYFYGAAANTSLFQMDFSSQTVVSTITAPTDCRAIAYNEDDGYFYANNWSSDIVVFDMSGTQVNSFAVGASGASYYGFAYDGYSVGAPFLWGYSQTGTTQNDLIQMQLPDGTETGVTFDVGSVAAVGTGIAGGLAISNEFVTGYYTIFGTAQNIDIWGLELVQSGPLPTNDVGIQSIVSPSSGMGLGNAEVVTVTIKNFGTDPQSNFDISYTLDGGTAVTETITETIDGGESIDHTFAGSVDLSAIGTYNFEACTYLTGDETPDNDCKTKAVVNSEPTYCDATTSIEDEFIANVLCGDIDNSSSWQGGVADYTSLSTFIPGGASEDIIVTNGNAWASDIVYVWVDWNNDFVFEQGGDEEFQLINVGSTGESFIGTIDAPGNAIPGNHRMRVRMTYSTPPEPCGDATYGEVEDYTIMTGVAEFGDLVGSVTENPGGAPIEGAMISVKNGSYTTISLSDGTYAINDILVGDWDISCTKDGYNPITGATVSITNGGTTTKDFSMTSPDFSVDPMSLDVTLDPNATTDETITISNPGSGDVNWSAAIVLLNENGPSDDMFDLQFDWPVGVGAGEAGIETDGNYIYTTKWNGGDFYKYGMDGTYIETFTCGSAANVRDLAYDGTYFYGGAASTTLFQMDFSTQTVVSTITAPTDVRAIAYNENGNVFYANNWSSDIVVFDMSGTQVSSFAVGASGASYYGFAYDGYSEGAPYLWGYSQTGNTQNDLIQMQLPDGTETGLTFDVGSVAAVGTGIAGGLSITDALVPGFYSFLGTSQNIDIWALELGPAGPVWLTIDPTSGSIASGGSETMTAHFDATGLLPAVYEAEIHFSTEPNVGSPVVAVTLTVEGLIPAINLALSYNCTDVELTWEMPTGGNPDSWKVYRDGEEIADVTEMNYTDALVDPEVEYSYYVTAVYAGEESMPTPSEMITVPTPTDLPPLDFDGTIATGGVNLTWSVPAACVAPDGYNIYRDGVKINNDLITELTYFDDNTIVGFYEYYATAVYYFIESEPSDAAYVQVITGIDDNTIFDMKVYPNPASDIVYIESDLNIKSIDVLNNVGQVILTQKVDANNSHFDVSTFEGGIYFIKMITDKGTVIRKIAVK